MHRFHGLWLAACAVLAAACSGGPGGSSGDPPPPPQRVTVSGVVVDETGRPYAGAWISIGPGLARSAADGTFTISNVTAPYDVTVVAESEKTITEVHGVTSATPILSFVRQDRGPLRTATVQGRVTDAEIVHLEVDTQVFGPSAYASARPDYLGDYSLATAWWGDTPATLNHRAMYMPTDAFTWWPEAFAYAVRPVAVGDGATVTAQDFSLSPLSTGSVSGDGTGHATYQTMFALVARFDDGIERTLFQRQWGESPLGAFDVLVPALPDGDARLEFSGWYSDGSGYAKASALAVAGQTGLTLALPPAPVPTGPVGPVGGGNGVAIGWTMTEWTGTDLVTVTCESGHVFRIAGRMRGTGVENLPALAVAVPTTTRCEWFPAWVSYTVEELVQGPAAVAALPLVRTSRGDGGHFYF